MKFEKKLNLLLLEDVEDVPNLRDLLKYNIPFIVIGARAVNAHIGRPRNTQDIDIITNDPEKFADAIEADYPDLERVDSEVVIRFNKDGDEVLDIIKPYHKIFYIAMENTENIGGYKSRHLRH